MIARLSVATPFLMVLPSDVHFSLHEYVDSGYQVRVLLPILSNLPLNSDVPDTITVDGQPGILANTLQIEFRAATFNREAASDYDPPREVISRALRGCLNRLRYVTRASQVSSIDFPEVTHRLAYLNDDGTELELKEGFVRTRFGRASRFSYIGISQGIWNHVHSLPPDWVPPRWHDLLLDANGAWPKVGTALVLAASALEVFIADTLDALASHKKLSEPLWEWINNRGQWLKDPSTDEQFDFLLNYFTGHSLKENKALWDAFKNLQTARNTFVHAGAAKIGGKEVTSQRAAELVAQTRAIVEWVRQWLPPELHWPDFQITTQVVADIRLASLVGLKQTDQPTDDASPKE